MAGIMVVDDEQELLVLYSEILSVLGHEIVASVPNGEEAIRIYKELENKPDLIILDHRMPIRNGLETATEILSQDPDEKIIFVSADSSVRKAALEMGVLDFLEKPFAIKALNDSIRRALSS